MELTWQHRPLPLYFAPINSFLTILIQVFSRSSARARKKSSNFWSRVSGGFIAWYFSRDKNLFVFLALSPPQSALKSFRYGPTLAQVDRKREKKPWEFFVLSAHTLGQSWKVSRRKHPRDFCLRPRFSNGLVGVAREFNCYNHVNCWGPTTSVNILLS
jgi:hypothetical protein